MHKIAKTYHCTNGWTSPISISDFGVQISSSKTNEIQNLGFEEFNFIDLFKKDWHIYHVLVQ